MGTHCTLVHNQGGKIVRVENTTGGHLIQNAFYDWAYEAKVMTPVKMGTGYIEIGAEGEGEQEYWVVLDYSAKKFLVGGFELNKRLINAVQHLYVIGWDLIGEEADRTPEQQMLFDVLIDPSRSPT